MIATLLGGALLVAAGPGALPAGPGALPEGPGVLPEGPGALPEGTGALPEGTGVLPAERVVSRGDGPLTASEQARRRAVVEALVAAEAQATEQPQTAEPRLHQALQDFAQIAPLVAEDEDAQDARVYAQLALARTRLARGDRAAAAEAIDAALREARGATLPVAQFGPSLTALHDERAAELAGRDRATLTVHCRAPCRVLVDEHPFESGPLPAGPHRVWVESRAPGLPVLHRAIDPAPGQAVTLRYDVAAPLPPSPPEDPVESPPAPSRRRLLPRWVEVTGLVAGVVGVGVGGALVAVDQRCPGDLRDPRRTPQCPRILDTDTGGLVLVGVAGAVAIGSAVLLAVDELRARRRRSPRSPAPR